MRLSGLHVRALSFSSSDFGGVRSQRTPTLNSLAQHLSEGLSESLDDGRGAETHAMDGLRRRLAEDTLFRY
jgi:hypothetical protein